MPNNVINNVHFEGEQRDIFNMLNKVAGFEHKPGYVDFNGIDPLPDELRIESSNRTMDGYALYSAYMKTRNGQSDAISEYNWPKKKGENVDALTWELGKIAFMNEKKYGSVDWYGWCIEHWGTKWNAYEQTGSPGHFCFYTAWNAPHKIMLTLSGMYPGITFTHSWADEDIGYNCGCRVYKDGHMVREYLPDYGVESIDFACLQWDCEPGDYNLKLNDDGTEYVYTEE